jgi:hypothetical protein
MVIEHKSAALLLIMALLELKIFKVSHSNCSRSLILIYDDNNKSLYNIVQGYVDFVDRMLLLEKEIAWHKFHIKNIRRFSSKFKRHHL